VTLRREDWLSLTVTGDITGLGALQVRSRENRKSRNQEQSGALVLARVHHRF
jgi:hypothetical protein